MAEKMKLNVNILETDSVIIGMILDSLVSSTKAVFNKIKPSLEKEVVNLLVSKIKNEPEYSSLINGTLKFEFGIPSDSYVDDTINFWANNFQLSVKEPTKTRRSINANISISMIKTDFSDVLSQPYASVIDSKSGAILPWLRWLLIDGSKILVKEHRVKIGANAASRTGMAVMVKSDSNWRVPSEYAGTVSNNWITRALDNIDQDIDSLLINILQRNL